MALKQALSVTDAAAERIQALEDGEALIIFPEGTRSGNG